MRRWFAPASVLLLAVVATGVGLGGAFAQADGTVAAPEVEDPCAAVLGAGSGAADPLAAAGLAGRSASAELWRQFVPVNVTCVGRVTAAESYVRGVFLELRERGRAGTAAVYVALHPNDHDETTVWQRYLRETFRSRLAFDTRGDGSLVALMTKHPSAGKAAAAYRAAGEAAPVWQAVEPLLDE